MRVRPVPPSTRASSNSRTAVFQTENEGATPSARSAQPRPPTRSRASAVTGNLRLLSHLHRGAVRRHDASRFSGEDRRLQHGARGFDSLSALLRPRPGRLLGHPAALHATRRSSHDSDHDGLATLDSLIRSPHCVRFAGDPRHANSARRWQSSDCACTTSRRRQVRSLRAAPVETALDPRSSLTLHAATDLGRHESDVLTGLSSREDVCLASRWIGCDSRLVHRDAPRAELGPAARPFLCMAQPG